MRFFFFQRMPIFVLVGIVLLGGAAFSVYMYLTEKRPFKDSQETPIISPEPGPFKTKPDDPGGYTVPHQDKEIYKAIKNKTEKEIENEALRPVAETPIETHFSLSKTPDSPKVSSQERRNAFLESLKPVNGKSSKNTKQEDPSSWREVFDALLNKTNPELESHLASKNTKETEKKIYRLYLGSSQSIKHTQKEWRRLLLKHKKYLKPLSLYIIPSHSSYMITAGEFFTSKEAQKICDKLVPLGTSCDVYIFKDKEHD